MTPLLVIVTRDDRYLICRRPDHKRHAGLWEFPGGKIESAETDLEAARRELREELDVEVVDVGEPIVEFADHGSPFVIRFVPTVIAGEPVRREHAEIRWATLASLRQLGLAPSDRRFVEMIASR